MAQASRPPGPSRGELRDARLRAELEPLAPGERPGALIAAVIVAVIVALIVLIGAATLHDLSSHGGSRLGGAFLGAVLLADAWGMWNRRYGAVLGFEALLAFQILVTALALTVAATVYAALLCVTSIGLSGWLFWKLVRVMGRLSAPQRSDPPPA